MGAEIFVTRAVGRSAKQAFMNAKEEAREEYGSGGYTGTIAEKRSFVEVTPPEGLNLKDNRAVESFIDKLLDDDNSQFSDKWGPAGCLCVDIREEGGEEVKKFVFFGWASC